tara:strand:+ start:38 stop:589 length:552 start_codon:yes stop_codon:yes gene_type:complete
VDTKHIIEVLIHSSPNPINSRDISHVLKDRKVDVSKIVGLINDEYQELNKGYRIEKIGGGYQLLSNPDYYGYIERLQQKTKKTRFSKAAIETLSIVAYKQPITRAEIEHIRGVDCSGVVKNLLEKDLLAIKGRDQGLGRALLYTTTSIFLELFGLDTLKDLPTLKELTQLINEEGEDSTPNTK